MKKFIVIYYYYRKDPYIKIVSSKNERLVKNEYTNNFDDPIIIELDKFDKDYKKAIIEYNKEKNKK